MTGFSHHLRNIPIVIGERDSDTYLRALSQLLAEAPEIDTEDWIIAAAKDAIRFVADDAFRNGFEASHTNVVVPLRENTIATSQALEAMRKHGEIVREAIVAKFEEAPGAPNQLTVDIEAIELPTPRTFR